MKLSISCPAVASTNWSILGSGKLSLGQALFRSVKSTHILHLLFFFFTRTMFATHSGYLTSRIDLAASSLDTSSFIAALLSRLKLLLFCTAGLLLSFTARSCEITRDKIRHKMRHKRSNKMRQAARDKMGDKMRDKIRYKTQDIRHKRSDKTQDETQEE